jgi:glycosyltransferase involved in cell wall biosynthesis
MRVLFVSAWFPYPPDNGSRIRAYNLIRSLSSRHQVYLVSLLQEDSLRENAEHLSGICEVVSLHESRWFVPGTAKSVLGFFSPRPRSCVDTYDPSVSAAVAEAIRRVSPDVVIASTLGVVEYIPRHLATPTVLDEHNCEYAVLKRNAEGQVGVVKQLRYGLRWRKFARWEASVCRGFDCVVMVSEKDREMLLAVAPDLEDVRVVPNGVDTDYYDCGGRSPEPNALLYNGALTYGANLDAVRYYARRIYPALERRLPGTKLRVTGRAQGVDLSGIADSSGVELTGYVSDIRDVLRRSLVCVVPLRQGGGSRLKILEAMASGLPVVSTSLGAEGIECTDGENILISDTPEGFAEWVARLVADADLSARISRSARRLVEEKYSWRMIGGAFTDIVESVAGRKPTRSVRRGSGT